MRRRRRLKPMSEKRAESLGELIAASEEVLARSGGLCEVCTVAPAVHLHHKLRRSQGGPNTADNLLHVCAEDHRLIHEYPLLAYEHGWLVKPHHEIQARRRWA